MVVPLIIYYDRGAQTSQGVTGGGNARIRNHVQSSPEILNNNNKLRSDSKLRALLPGA